MQRSDSGFTLVELSIVLVIIGLLAGGTMVGSSMMRTSSLRAVITEADQYKTAIRSFRLQYNAIPGDFTRATTLWGGATVNGNGNGYIDSWPGEGARLWQHLALAGLISGTYTSYLGVGTLQVGVHVPASKLARSGYHSMGGSLSNPVGFENGANRANDRNCTNVLTPVEARDIDSKIDDGKPSAGFVRGDIDGYEPTGWVDASDCISGGNYLVNDSVRGCRLLWTIR